MSGSFSWLQTANQSTGAHGSRTGAERRCSVERKDIIATLQNATLQTIVWTSDVAQAATFYSDVLGRRQTGTSHGAAVFGVCGRELRLSPVPETSPTEHTVVGFAVKDLASVDRDLKAKGLDMERLDGFPHDDQGILKTPEGAAVAWIRDPNGNLISIVQYK